MFKELFAESKKTVLTVKLNNENITYAKEDIFEMINEFDMYMGTDNLPKWLYFALLNSTEFILRLGTRSKKKIEKYAREAVKLILNDVLNGKVKKIEIKGKNILNQYICDDCIDNVSLSVYAEQVKK